MLNPTPVAGRARGWLDTVVGERLASEVRESLPVLGIGVDQPVQPRFSDCGVQPSKTLRPPHVEQLASLTHFDNRLDTRPRVARRCATKRHGRRNDNRLRVPKSLTANKRE